MSRKAFIFCLSAGAFLASASSAAPSLRDVKAGDYLFDGYVSRIAKKELPCAAARAVSDGPTEITATRKKGRLRLFVGNFHEGVTDFYIGTDGGIVHGAFTPPKALSLNPDGSLLLTLEKGPPRRFVYVKESAAFVANALLAGDYMDSAGKKYSFGKDGRASLGAAKFKYTMMLDCVGLGDTPGWFMNAKTNEGYIFGLKDGSLTVYRYDVEREESDSRPFISARRTAP